ncbi:MAG TPA: diacylglycerol kinase family protein [Thermoanaerobaculia bacterium]
MPSKGTLFFNPSSGAGLSESDRDALRAAASDAGLEVVRLNREIDSAQTIRERMSRGVRLFVAAGGDGTINNVVQPLVNTDATLAVIPVGTYNHFAKDLEIPLDWREALDIAFNGDTRQVDAARVNDRFFVNNLSLGLYPELVARREERGRDYPRWRARLYAAYATLKKYPHVTLNIETEHHAEVVRTHVFIVSNNSYDLSGLGIEAARSTLEEGRLSVYWLPHLSRLRLATFMAHYLAGHVRETPGFRSFRTAAMKVQTARPTFRVGVDGELFTMKTPLTITIVPKSLQVRCPRVQ